MVSPIVASPDPRGPWFSQTWICTMSESFHVNLNFSGSVVLEKKIFKDFSYISTCKNGLPYCGPIQPPGAMILTNLNLHYVKKLPCKFELFWQVVLEKKIFQFLHFCDYFPFEEDLVLHLNKLEFPSPKNDLYQVWLKLACWFWRRRFF